MSWNLDENLRKTASEFPDQVAYMFMDESTSYARLNELVDRFASALIRHGIGKGDAVAVLLGNHPNFVIAYYSILRTGAAVVPINPIYTQREIEYILSNCKARAVIAASELHSMLSTLRNEQEQLQLLIYTEPLDPECYFDHFLQEQILDSTNKTIDSEDLAVILYTSGTTGTPKGAMLTHRNMASNAVACIELFQLVTRDRMVTVLPIYHVFCMTVCMNAVIACGATMLIIPKFSPAEVVKTIKEEQATLFAGVPTMYNFIYQLPHIIAEDLKSLRGCISGGAPIPLALLQNFEEKFQVRIFEGYGLSEASPVTAFNPFNGVRKPGSIGINIPLVENIVVDENGREVPRGEVGELIVRGPNVMKGYLGMSEATELVLQEGWLYTGDMATMDEEGYLYIVDRKKDTIIVGGYNVYPREVEEVLYQHPDVVEAAVIGVLDEQYGEAVQAYVVTNGASLSAGDLITFCQDKLAKYKLPKYVDFTNSLPKNSTGKILRRALRK